MKIRLNSTLLPMKFEYKCVTYMQNCPEQRLGHEYSVSQLPRPNRCNQMYIVIKIIV